MNPKIEEIIRKDEESLWKWEERTQAMRLQGERTREKLNKLPLRRALPIEYMKWLRGFIEAGGSPTHSYEYSMPNSLSIATRSFELEDGMCGALAVNVIVPIGIECRGGARGHCNLYYMDEFRCDGGFVPIYTDTRF